MSNNTYWKKRFEDLKYEAMDIFERAEQKEETDIPDEPISTSDVLCISNDWQVTDNEEYAADVWGSGKYQKWVRA